MALRTTAHRGQCQVSVRLRTWRFRLRSGLPDRRAVAGVPWSLGRHVKPHGLSFWDARWWPRRTSRSGVRHNWILLGHSVTSEHHRQTGTWPDRRSSEDMVRTQALACVKERQRSECPPASECDDERESRTEPEIGESQTALTRHHSRRRATLFHTCKC